jgi:hypothetical protein
VWLICEELQILRSSAGHQKNRRVEFVMVFNYFNTKSCYKDTSPGKSP